MSADPSVSGSGTQPEIHWPHQPDFSQASLGFAPAPQIERILLYRADGSTPGCQGAYSHHAHICFYAGALFAMWSNHLKNEDYPGQRVFLMRSTDLGQTWIPSLGEKPMELFPSLDDWKCEKDALSDDDLTGTANGFALLDSGELYAVNEVLPNGSRQSQGLGRLVRRIFNDGALGEIFWIEPDPPQARPGFPGFPGLRDPAYAQLGARIKACLTHESRRQMPTWDFKGPRNTTTELESRLAGSPTDGHRLCEPTPSFALPDGRLGVLWRDLGGNGPRSGRLYLSHSADGGRHWTAPVQTAFPDAGSRPFAGNLPDGTVFVVNNPGRDRLVLTLSLAKDGKHFSTCYAVRWGATSPRFAGLYKNSGYAYPHTCVAGGFLFIAYSINKEDIEVCRVPIGALAG